MLQKIKIDQFLKSTDGWWKGGNGHYHATCPFSENKDTTAGRHSMSVMERGGLVESINCPYGHKEESILDALGFLSGVDVLNIFRLESAIVEGALDKLLRSEILSSVDALRLQEATRRMDNLVRKLTRG